MAVRVILLPTQALGEEAAIAKVRAGGCEIKTVCVTEQLLLKSLAITVYCPAARLVAIELVWALGVHVYE